MYPVRLNTNLNCSLSFVNFGRWKSCIPEFFYLISPPAETSWNTRSRRAYEFTLCNHDVIYVLDCGIVNLGAAYDPMANNGLRRLRASGRNLLLRPWNCPSPNVLPPIDEIIKSEPCLEDKQPQKFKNIGVGSRFIA